MTPALTDADRADCLRVSGVREFTEYGREYAERIYLAGLAAGAAREREDAALKCEMAGKNWATSPAKSRHERQRNLLRSAEAFMLAAAIRADGTA